MALSEILEYALCYDDEKAKYAAEIKRNREQSGSHETEMGVMNSTSVITCSDDESLETPLLLASNNIAMETCDDAISTAQVVRFAANYDGESDALIKT